MGCAQTLTENEQEEIRLLEAAAAPSVRRWGTQGTKAAPAAPPQAAVITAEEPSIALRGRDGVACCLRSLVALIVRPRWLHA